jgi:hypothetical protein
MTGLEGLTPEIAASGIEEALKVLTGPGTRSGEQASPSIKREGRARRTWVAGSI